MKDSFLATYKKELLKTYVSEKEELVRLELILDNLFMATIKDKEWEEKEKIALNLYNETKDLVEFLTHEFYKAFNY